jgi:cytochrome c oxidase assembly protein subunit 15
MLVENESLKTKLIYWLFLGCFLIFGMVVVGGITRLTGSGLSITEWKVVTGTIPPLNEEQWNIEFEKYKQIPQYALINSNFTLSDFKFIFFWEYIHRLFGRLIGLVFVAGFVYFYRKKAISKELLPRLITMFILGGIQGFLGWYMVSSGLTENVRVSHIRLAIHLTFAFITFGYIFYVALTELFPNKLTSVYAVTKYKKWSQFLLIVLTLQIIYGAFVAGTKAGLIYNTWPKMEQDWIPESVSFAFAKDGFSSLYNNLVTVQFIHRLLAYTLTLIVLFIGWKVNTDNTANSSQKNASKILLGLIVVQVVLGIATLLLHVPIWMGVTHQAVAFFLFAATIYFIQRLNYTSN